MAEIQSTPIRIGVCMDAWAKYLGIYTQCFLKDKGIESQIILYPDNQAVSNALLSAEASIIPTSLKDLATTLPEGMTIAALSERDEARQCLVLPRNLAKKVDVSALTNLRIGTCTTIQSVQLAALFSEVIAIAQTDKLTPLESIEALHTGIFDGVIMPSEAIKSLAMPTDEWDIRPFNPREFVPEVGQGVVSLLVATEDLATRRLLKKAHNQKVAMATNVERTLKKMFNDTDIAVHCERDKMGNYHLSAAALVEGTLRKTRLSQSTTIGLAENMYKTLING